MPIDPRANAQYFPRLPSRKSVIVPGAHTSSTNASTTMPINGP